MTRRSLGGFTLIEVIIFIVVVSAGLVGILLVSNTVVKSSADPVVRKQAVAVAESMLEEILLKEYCDPDTVDSSTTPPTCGLHTTEGSRALYDDVDDYAGYASNAAVGIVDVSGNPVPGLSAYNVVVAVGAPAAVSGGGATALKMVTVTVTWGGGSAAVVGYKGNY